MDFGARLYGHFKRSLRRGGDLPRSKLGSWLIQQSGLRCYIDHQPNGSESQASQGFPVEFEILDSIVIINIVGPQEAVNLITGLKTEQSPQVRLMEMP